MMKAMRIFILASFVATVSISSAQEAVLLRLVLTPGLKLGYSSVTKSKQVVSGSPMGDQDINVTTTAKMSYDFVKVDKEKGIADLDLKLYDLKLDLEGIPGLAAGVPAPELPKEISGKAKINTRNQISDLKYNGNVPKGRTGMGGGLEAATAINNFAFPEKPVKPGDTWQVPMPKSAFIGKSEGTLTAKFVGLKTVNNQAVYEILVSGTVPFETDMSRMGGESPDSNSPMQGMSMKTKGTADIQSTLLFDKATGILILSTAKIKTKAQMDLAQLGMTLDINGDTTTEIKQVK